MGAMVICRRWSSHVLSIIHYLIVSLFINERYGAPHAQFGGAAQRSC